MIKCTCESWRWTCQILASSW